MGIPLFLWSTSHITLMIFALSPSTNTFLIALLIPVLGVISPLLIARQINKNAMAVKQLDWDRQDLVAERAAEVAKKASEAAQLVVDRQIVIDKKTDEVARLVATSTSETNVKLKEIHGLVNSQMTEAIRSELGATRDTLAMMGELIENNRKSGVEPSMHVLAAFKGREAKIRELEEVLQAREKADNTANNVKEGPSEVVIVNPEPVPVVDTTTEEGGKNE